MSSSSRFASRRQVKAKTPLIVNAMTADEIDSIEFDFPTLADLERMRSPLRTPEVERGLVEIAARILALEAELTAHITAKKGAAIGPVRPFAKRLDELQSSLDEVTESVTTFGDAKSKPRQNELKALKDKQTALKNELEAHEGAFSTFAARDELLLAVKREEELQLAQATVEDKERLPAVERKLAEVRAELAKSKGGNTVFHKAIVPQYTTREGVKTAIHEAVLILPFGGRAIWDSKFESEKIAFTAPSDNEAAYAFATAIDAAWEMVHEMFEQEFYLDWINASEKNVKNHLTSVKVITLADPDHTYTKKDTNEVVDSPQLKFRTEFMVGSVTKEKILRCTITELDKDGEAYVTTTPVMRADRPMSLERVEDLRTAKNQYLQKFGIITEMYPELHLAKGKEYEKLESLIKAGDAPPDMMTVADLRERIEKKSTEMQIKVDLGELCVSKAAGVCFALKAKNLSIYVTEGADSGPSTIDQDAINQAMAMNRL